MLPARQPSPARAAVRLTIRYGRPYRGWFLRAMGATLLVVGGRLAMPWPLRGILDLASGAAAGPHAGWLPAALAWVGVYVAIAAGLGFVERAQRVRFKGFATRTVNAMRGAAVEATRSSAARKRTPDLLTRIIGDTARIKAELSGILVHVSQNGLYFAGVCAVFLFLSPPLSAVFLVCGIFSVGVGYGATRRISAVVGRQRARESEYAGYVHDVLHGRVSKWKPDRVNEDSALEDTTATRLIATAAWILHVGLAVIAGVGLLVAIHEVEHGRLLLGEVFLFIAYLLTVHRRMIQIGRQIARGGKFIANVTRVGELIAAAGGLPPGGRTPASPGVAPQPGLPPRRTAVIAAGGCDGEALLRVTAREGEGGAVGFVPRNPPLGRRRLSHFVPDPALLETAEARLLRLDGSLGDPQDLQRRASTLALTRHQAQALRIGRLLWVEHATPRWVIEDPVSGLSERKAQRVLHAILGCAGEREVSVSLPDPSGALSGFDRLLVLEPGGLVVFDGPPAEWGGFEEAVPHPVAAAPPV
jgi:hypothetical protein